MTDAQKAMLAGATVKVTNVATGQARETVTSADGVYTVVSLAVGTYRVEVALDGFQKGVHEVSVGISETARADVVLEVSGVTESVTVAGAAAAIETTQGRISGRVDRTQLQEMPLNGRNLYNLIALQPGVTGKGVSSTFGAGGNGNDSFSGESAPRINAGGQRDEANSFTLDDTSTNGVARGGITNLTPNAESVEEIRVVANNFSAVDGRNSGAQIQVISKGGTNTFRGSASFYYQDEGFTTKNVFETAVPEFSKKQFGYSFGGPIVQESPLLLHLVRGPATSRRTRVVVHRRDPGVQGLRGANVSEQHCRGPVRQLPARRLPDVDLPRHRQSRAGRLTEHGRRRRRHHGRRGRLLSSPTSGATATSSTFGRITSCGPERTGCTPTSIGPRR